MTEPSQENQIVRHYETADEYKADVARMETEGWRISEKSKEGPAVTTKAVLTGGLVGAALSARRFRPMEVTWVRNVAGTAPATPLTTSTVAPLPVGGDGDSGINPSGAHEENDLEPPAGKHLPPKPGKDVKFRFTNYDGGVSIHPQPEPAGTLIVSGSQPRWELHWPTQGVVIRKKPYVHFGLTRYLLEPESTGPTSSHVAIRDIKDPNLSAHFDLPDTSADELRLVMQTRVDEFSQARAKVQAQVTQIKVAQASGQWWVGLQPASLYPVLHGAKRDKGTLKVTAEGLHWSLGFSKVRISWAAISNIEVGEITRQHGKQHSAIGFGGIGLAVVAATALHNHRAARADVYHALVITTSDGKRYQFLTEKALSPLAPMYQAFRTQYPASVPASPPRPSPAPTRSPALGVADELAKLADLHNRGVLSDEEFAAQKAKLLGS